YGAPQYGTPQNGTPQFGAPQFGAPQYGAPQYGAPQYGAPQDGGFGGPGFPGPDPNSGAGTPGELLPRLGARIIDGLIVGIPMGILSAIMIIASGGSGFVDFFMTVVSGVVAFGYWTYMESARGATIGKKLLGLSVAGPAGGNPTIEQAAKRNAF